MHTKLGYVSLNQRLSNDEVLGVAFQYTVGGQVFQVGEFANDGVEATEADVDPGTGNTVVNNNNLRALDAAGSGLERFQHGSGETLAAAIAAAYESKELRVDGGASANNLMMQFQSDIFGFDVVRPQVLETTALGAAYLAGLAVGFWNSMDELQSQWSVDQRFAPSKSSDEMQGQINQWHKAVSRVKDWARE